MTYLAFTLIALGTPAALLALAHHNNWARKISIIVLCYLAGLIAGNSGLIPETALPLQSQITDLSIALAMPLLLFSLDIRQWGQVAGKAILSMVLATTSVVTLATCLFFVFHAQGVESASNFAAMSVGVYTGGTPNLAAIKTGLNIPDAQYLIFHSLDTVVGSAYLLLMLSFGPAIFRRLLLPSQQLQQANERQDLFDADNYYGMLRWRNAGAITAPILLSALVVGAAWGISQAFALLTGDAPNTAILMVALTTLGIVASLNSRVRQLALSYKLGMYLVYIFCFVVASMASLSQLAEVNFSIATFLIGTIVGSVLLHALFSRLLKVDAETFMVTSVSAVCSPPFVPMMARAMGNPGAVHSGMTTGIIGYVLGNYLGIGLGLALQGL